MFVKYLNSSKWEVIAELKEVETCETGLFINNHFLGSDFLLSKYPEVKEDEIKEVYKMVFVMLEKHIESSKKGVFNFENTLSAAVNKVCHQEEEIDE